MTRLYFDCPIKAAYMWKEFNVNTYLELTREDQTIPDVLLYFDCPIKNVDWEGRSIKLDGRKYYIAPESEHIFEPKKGDLAHYDLNGGSGVNQFTNKPIRWAEGVTNIQIIRRDNKQFFAPLKEV